MAMEGKIFIVEDEDITQELKSWEDPHLYIFSQPQDVLDFYQQETGKKFPSYQFFMVFWFLDQREYSHQDLQSLWKHHSIKMFHFSLSQNLSIKELRKWQNEHLTPFDLDFTGHLRWPMNAFILDDIIQDLSLEAKETEATEASEASEKQEVSIDNFETLQNFVQDINQEDILPLNLENQEVSNDLFHFPEQQPNSEIDSTLSIDMSYLKTENQSATSKESLDSKEIQWDKNSPEIEFPIDFFQNEEPLAPSSSQDPENENQFLASDESHDLLNASVEEQIDPKVAQLDFAEKLEVLDQLSSDPVVMPSEKSLETPLEFDNDLLYAHKSTGQTAVFQWNDEENKTLPIESLTKDHLSRESFQDQSASVKSPPENDAQKEWGASTVQEAYSVELRSLVESVNSLKYQLELSERRRNDLQREVDDLLLERKILRKKTADFDVLREQHFKDMQLTKTHFEGLIQDLKKQFEIEKEQKFYQYQKDISREKSLEQKIQMLEQDHRATLKIREEKILQLIQKQEAIEFRLNQALKQESLYKQENQYLSQKIEKLVDTIKAPLKDFEKSREISK
jgi:hypothetical protein